MLICYQFHVIACTSTQPPQCGGGELMWEVTKRQECNDLMLPVEYSLRESRSERAAKFDTALCAALIEQQYVEKEFAESGGLAVWGTEEKTLYIVSTTPPKDFGKICFELLPVKSVPTPSGFEEVYNLTNHNVDIILDNRRQITLTPDNCDEPARLTMERREVKKIGGVIPLIQTIYYEPKALPVERQGVYLIVSQMLKLMYPMRGDLVVPADLIKNRWDEVMGCKALGI